MRAYPVRRKMLEDRPRKRLSAPISGLFFTRPKGARFITPSGLAPSTRCRAPSGYAGPRMNGLGIKKLTLFLMTPAEIRMKAFGSRRSPGRAASAHATSFLPRRVRSRTPASPGAEQWHAFPFPRESRGDRDSRRVASGVPPDTGSRGEPSALAHCVSGGQPAGKRGICGETLGKVFVARVRHFGMDRRTSDEPRIRGTREAFSGRRALFVPTPSRLRAPCRGMARAPE